MKATNLDYWLEKHEILSQHDLYIASEPYLKFIFLSIFLTTILHKILQKLITNYVHHHIKKSKIAQLVIGPVYFFIIGSIIHLLFVTIIRKHYDFAGNVFFTVAATAFFRILYNLSDIYIPHLLEGDFAKDKLDSMSKTITKFILKLTRTLLVILCLVTILERWEVHVVTFLAGFGLVGMAVALAAQDTLKNLLSSVVIVSDQIFREGDHIKFGEIEGYVENIGLRSTALRHPDKSLILVPNSELSNMSIVNLSKMQFKRLRFTLGLTYATKSSVLKKLIERIKEYIKTNDDISQDPTLSTAVVLKDFGDYSIDILCNLFLVKTKWLEYSKAKEKILFDIMQILEEEGAEQAFPTQSIYIEKNEV